MLEEYIHYDRQFLNQVIGSLTKYQLIGLDETCILIEDKKYQIILDQLMMMYLNLSLAPNYQTIKPQTLDAKTTLELANDSFTSIFPRYQKTITNYDNLLYSYENFHFQESSLEYHVTEKGKIILNQIALPEDSDEYTPGMINHEKMHAFMMQKINLKNYPIIYMELLSMLIQKITNYQVEKTLNLNTTHIIDGIVRTIDNQQHLSVLDILKDINLMQESVNNHLIYQYLNLKANDYLLSDWYSDFLIEYYVIDPKILKDKLNQLFRNEITIQELLNYYGISLGHKSLIPNIEKKLIEVKKYSIQQ